MSDLSDALTQYLAIRRTLGRVDRLVSSLLHHLIAFVDEAGSPFITTDLVRQWALQPTGAHPSTWAGRLVHCTVSSLCYSLVVVPSGHGASRPGHHAEFGH